MDPLTLIDVACLTIAAFCAGASVGYLVRELRRP